MGIFLEFALKEIFHRFCCFAEKITEISVYVMELTQGNLCGYSQEIMHAKPLLQVYKEMMDILANFLLRYISIDKSLSEVN